MLSRELFSISLPGTLFKRSPTLLLVCVCVCVCVYLYVSLSVSVCIFVCVCVYLRERSLSCTCCSSLLPTVVAHVLNVLATSTRSPSLFVDLLVRC
jgi:hypothetical protein